MQTVQVRAVSAFVPSKFLFITLEGGEFDERALEQLERQFEVWRAYSGLQSFEEKGCWLFIERKKSLERCETG